MNGHSFPDSWRVAIQMGVVLAVYLLRIELIDRVAAKTAIEQLGNSAVANCQDRRAARRHDVSRLMGLTIGADLPESVTGHSFLGKS